MKIVKSSCGVSPLIATKSFRFRQIKKLAPSFYSTRIWHLSVKLTLLTKKWHSFKVCKILTNLLAKKDKINFWMALRQKDPKFSNILNHNRWWTHPPSILFLSMEFRPQPRQAVRNWPQVSWNTLKSAWLRWSVRISWVLNQGSSNYCFPNPKRFRLIAKFCLNNKSRQNNMLSSKV